jgi:hypothetical protein
MLRRFARLKAAGLLPPSFSHAPTASERGAKAFGNSLSLAVGKWLYDYAGGYLARAA